MGALQGIKVVELGSIGPGPMCAMLLADHGADVVRIDRLVASGLGLAMAPQHDVTARSRRSVALDLKDPAGRDAALALMAQADVLIEGWRPGVAEKLGLGPAPAQALNPRLVYGRMTGYGQTGPLATVAGHDINYAALSGALHAIGPAGSAPQPPLNLVADYGGGALYLAFGILAALLERQHSGRGQVVDAAMVDGASSLMSLFHGLAAAGDWNPAQRGANLLDGGAPFYACYATADGQWLSVGALEPKFFAELAQLIGLPPHFVVGQHDRALWPALRAALSEIFLQRSRAEWCTLLAGRDCCVAPVLRFDEAPDHAQALARDAFVSVAGVRQPAPAPRLDRTPAGLPTPAPQLGQHTRAVLAELGWPAERIDALLHSGAAHQQDLA
jgi:alpha-methylacyl-CoA racemase